MVSTQTDRADGLSSATALKGPCRCATTANITLSGLQTIDAVSLAAGDRVLVKNQSTAADNGIWIAATGAWSRARDFSLSRDIRKGTSVNVTDGTVNGGAWWTLSTADSVVVGTTALSFSQLFGAQVAAAQAAADAAEAARDVILALDYVEQSEVGAVNGVAPLGSDGKVPSAYLDSVGVTDGDRGDIVVSDAGATWLLDLPTDGEAQLGALTAKGMNAAKTRIAVSSQTGCIDVNTYSDGTGTAANDQAALDAALADARLNPTTKTVLLTRDFKLSSQLNLDTGGLSVAGANKNVKLLVQTDIDSCLYITESNVSVSNLTLDNVVYGRATAGIKVNKPWSTMPIFLSRLNLSSFETAIDWANGDMPNYDDIRAVACKDNLRFRNNGMNGFVSNIRTWGGRGVVIGKDTSLADKQQMEGTSFVNLNILMWDTVNGVATGNAIDISGGLVLNFTNVVVDQVWHGDGISLKTVDGNAPDSIKFFGLWVGATGTGLGDSTINGFNLQGGSRGLSIFGGRMHGMKNTGITLNGLSTAASIGARVDSVMFTSCGRDLYTAYSTGTFTGNYFEGTTAGVYEVVGGSHVGVGNYFAIAPAGILSSSQWLSNLGPGAFRGIPAASTGLVAGKMWIDTAASNVVKMV